MSLQQYDAFANIGKFDYGTALKIRLWYPRLEAAQRKARDALAGMMLVLNVPPIVLSSDEYKAWTENRKAMVEEYNASWQAYENLLEEFSKAKTPKFNTRGCVRNYLGPNLDTLFLDTAPCDFCEEEEADSDSYDSGEDELVEKEPETLEEARATLGKVKAEIDKTWKKIDNLKSRHEDHDFALFNVSEQIDKWEDWRVELAAKKKKLKATVAAFEAASAPAPQPAAEGPKEL